MPASGKRAPRTMSEAEPIIHGEEWKEFARHYAAKRCGVATAGEPGRFRALLSDWEIDAICRFVPLPANGAIRMHFHGTPVNGSAYRSWSGRVDHAGVRRLLESGASLNILRLEHYSNAVLRFTRALEAEFRCPVQVNLYQTPAGGQGLGSHVDKHDVLVLQLAGEKEWRISGMENPGSTAHAHSSTPSPSEWTAVLRDGDWLYVPRGIRHEVRNSGAERSVHFTVGFHPLTWGAILERALEKARTAGRLLHEPVGANPEPVGVDRLDELLAFVDVQAELDRHREFYRALGVPIAAADVPHRGVLDASGADTVFAWRAGAACANRTTTGLELDLPYRRAPLVLYLDLVPMIERMACASSFRPRDFGGVEDVETAMLLARFLAGAGVLALG